MNLSKIRKAVAALTAGGAVMVAAGLITGDPAAWWTGSIAALTAGLAVYAAPPNQPPIA